MQSVDKATAAGLRAARPLGPTEVKRLNRRWRHRTQSRICLLLEAVGQPFNVGSIVRTAAAFGVERIWLCGSGPSPAHPSARKTSLGTERLVHWDKLAETQAGLAAARAAGLPVIVIEQAAGAVPVHDAPLAGDVCLALGNEDRGCSPTLLGGADVVAYIPQTGRVGSLNVAVAAAIALAESRRQEWSACGAG